MSFNNENPRSLPESVAFGLMVLVLVASPWLLGGVLLEHQFYLWLAVVACAALTWLGAVSNPATDLAGRPWWMLPILLFLGVGVAQLFPVSFAMSNWTHVAIPDMFPQLSTRSVWTIDAALSRIQVVRFIGAAVLMWAASHLCASERARQFMWWSLAINGGLLTVFGVVQRVWWNGKLYGVIELTHGGQPFAAFVNRNHAAGYLNLCLAAALLLWWTNCASSKREPAGRLPDEAGFSTREILPALLVLLNALGVCASFSRGGILSLVAALVAVVMLSGAEFRTRALSLLLVIGTTLAVLLSSTNQGEVVRDRLSTIQDSATGADGRWQHWRDTIPAVLDAPWGTGLGTYRRANRPFQSHATPGLFYNADNLYLDMLVEMGWLGIGLIAVAMLLLVRRVWQLARHSNPAARTLSLLGMSLLVSQGLQSATDFGPLMTANLMLIATLCGALYAEVPALDEDDMPVGADRSGRANLTVGGILILASLSIVPVLNYAREAESLVRSLPSDRQPVDMSNLAMQLATSERLLRQYPDDGELQQVRAQLLILSYRTRVFEELKLQGTTLQEQELWNRTSLSFLFELVLDSRDDDATLEQYRSHSAIQRYLVPAAAALRDAIEASPLKPESRMQLGLLLPATSRNLDPEEWGRLFREEASLVPDSPERLFQLGGPFRQEAEHATRDRLWARALLLDPARQERLLKQMIALVGEDEVLGLLPPDVLLHVELIRLARSPEVLRAAASTAIDLAKQANLAPEVRDYALGMAHAATKSWDLALPRLRAAVQARPTNLNWRIELVSVLKTMGLHEEAKEQLGMAVQQAPGRRDLLQQYQAL